MCSQVYSTYAMSGEVVLVTRGADLGRLWLACWCWCWVLRGGSRGAKEMGTKRQTLRTTRKSEAK
jgi:hypothetical protein